MHVLVYSRVRTCREGAQCLLLTKKKLTLILRFHALILRWPLYEFFRILSNRAFPKNSLRKKVSLQLRFISVCVWVCVYVYYHFSTLTSPKSLKLLCSFMHAWVIGFFLIQDQLFHSWRKQNFGSQNPQQSANRIPWTKKMCDFTRHLFWR